MPSARRWLIFAAAVIGVLAIVLFVTARQLRPRLHAEVVKGLSEHLDSEVTLEHFDIRLFPRPSLSGRDLVVRHQGRTDIPPLVTVGSFSGHTSWRMALVRRMDDVKLEGLEIVIPPRRKADMPSLDPPPSAGDGEEEGPKPPFGVNQLTATNARLTIMPKRDDKDPLVFDIHSLVVGNLTFVQPSTYEAELTNPIPFGRIKAQGSFGPWAKEEPGDTPVDGTYVFNADLGTIKGVAGKLDAEGTLTGAVSHIATKGTTKTPDFSLPKLKAAAMPLSTSYQAIVDGTNGDVVLERVEARLADSHFVAAGSIVGTKGIKGKRIVLDVTSEDALMEDLLRLTVRHAPPAMTGAVRLQTSFDLPQGEQDVIDKLLLEGKVSIKTARFTSDNVQDRIDDLSRRGSGRPNDESIDNVASNLATNFDMKDGRIRLSDLTYAVPGAAVSMAGTYTLESGALDFAGVARLEASASDTQTGFKHFLLMPFNPLLRKGGAGTRVAITVGGTVDEPKFGVDFGRTLKGK
jgi:hypothetical protein